MISANIAALAYLVAGALFILALRGLSSPTTARRGNTMGMVGMTIAVLTTLAIAAPTDPFAWVLIIGGLAIGGGLVMGTRIGGVVRVRCMSVTARVGLGGRMYGLGRPIKATVGILVMIVSVCIGESAANDGSGSVLYFPKGDIKHNHRNLEDVEAHNFLYEVVSCDDNVESNHHQNDDDPIVPQAKELHHVASGLWPAKA